MQLIRYSINFVLLLALYYLGGRLGLLLEVYYGDVTPLWPPSGLALAMIWFSGWRWAPVIIVGELLSAMTLQQSILNGVIGGIGQLSEVACAMLMIRYFGITPYLSSVGDSLRFIGLAALLAPLFGAGLGVAGQLSSGLITPGQAGATWMTWWLGDSIGIMIITPLIRFWWVEPPSGYRLVLRWLTQTSWVAMFFTAAFVIMPDKAWTLFFLLLPYVVYTSITLGKQGASLSLVALAALVLGEGAQGISSDFMISVKMAFVGTCTLLAYVVTANFETNRTIRSMLATERNRLRTTLMSISDGVIKVDERAHVVFMNPMAEQLTGWSERAAMEKPFVVICPLKTLQEPRHPANPVEFFLAQTQRDAQIESYAFESADDGARTLEIRIRRVVGGGGRGDRLSNGAVIVLRDISDEVRLRRQLEHQALHDPLTDLPNRRALDNYLHRLLSENTNHLVSGLLYIDLDQFKLINDTCGHEVGDLLLKKLSSLLRKNTPERGMLARISGDEFALVIEGVTEAQTLAVAEQVRQTISHCQLAYEDLVFSVGASIGVTFITEQDNSRQAVLSRADIACYQAKESGRDRVRVYHAGDTVMLRYHGELEWLSQLKNAIQMGHFELYQQGIFCVDENGDAVDMPGCEVLIRLRRQDEMVSPGSFIPVAERFGFMPIIDRWVTETLFRRMSNSVGLEFIYNVNLSGATFNDHGFFKEVEGWAEKYRIDRSRVCFEVTESVALADIAQTREIIRSMAQKGYRFALDDFGSGSASYGYLSELPVNYVKLDGGFVRRVLEDPSAEIVIESLVKIARLRNMHCIAECVESRDIACRMVKLGISVLQGFFYDRPKPMGPITKSEGN
ncbi:EAL domain-containing protein [Hahella aquimaris]|uniref:bifunctional diguanylate cyclase/phosphodiesterase n=1 Tax=Hahella sp. HNIBRBA332 TaxID=3015983 RepID=UPI00273C060B|nr:EAL domain-containing protein [Hahella sp. HNIBRBA332]WLQ14846.1 EAL domain-containing protein [Hahella sp. HNIBRBA332]